MSRNRKSAWSYRIDATDHYKTAALYYLTQKHDEAHWMQLLLWAENTWEADNYRYATHPRSPRQREQQKLAGQLRAITGILGLANHLRATGNGMIFYPLDKTIPELRQVEDHLRNALKSIKERIPK